MKKLFISTSLLVFSVLFLTGCYEFPEHKSIPGSSGLIFEANMTAWEPYLPVNDLGEKKVFTSNIDGDGTSNCHNLMNFKFNQRHVMVKTPNGVQITDGMYVINGGTCQIYGSYTGFGTCEDGILKAKLILEVEGGTGYYEGSKGSLTADLNTNPGVSEYLNITLNGRISCPAAGYDVDLSKKGVVN